MENCSDIPSTIPNPKDSYEVNQNFVTMRIGFKIKLSYGHIAFKNAGPIDLNQILTVSDPW